MSKRPIDIGLFFIVIITCCDYLHAFLLGVVSGGLDDFLYDSYPVCESVESFALYETVLFWRVLLHLIKVKQTDELSFLIYPM